jgi:hypothetical protein
MFDEFAGNPALSGALTIFAACLPKATADLPGLRNVTGPIRNPASLDVGSRMAPSSGGPVYAVFERAIEAGHRMGLESAQ